MRYVNLIVIVYTFYEWNKEKRKVNAIQFVKRIQKRRSRRRNAWREMIFNVA